MTDDKLWTPEHRASAESLYDLLYAAAQRFGDAPYLPPADESDLPVSFAETLEFVRRLDAFLTEQGVGEGDRVSFVLHNSTTTALIFLGVVATGRVLVPLNPKSGAAEIDHIRRQTEPAILLSDAVLVEQLGLSGDIRLIGSDAEFYREVRATSVDPSVDLRHRVRGSQDAEVVYLPDVSGQPKGVVLTHANLLAEAFALGQRFGFTSEDAFMTVIGLFHNSGQVFSLITPLWCGARGAVVRPEVAMLRFWNLVERHRPTWTLLVPSYLEMLVSGKQPSTPPTLKGVLAGGAKLSAELIDQFETVCGINVYQCYGLAETTSVATVEEALPQRLSRGSAGTAIPSCEVMIFDREGAPVGAGVPGEVWIRGENVFDRYYALPDITAAKLIDGWLHTGDLGKIDEHGNLHILGRFDDLVIIGGENVYPSEVEKLLGGLVGVEEGYLVAVPHKVMGVELVLVYRLAENASPDPDGWRAELVKHLSVFKVPRRWVQVHEIGVPDVPRTPAGMLDRPKLTNLATAFLAQG